MNLKKIGKIFTSKFVGTGPSSYKKRIYRDAISQRLRNTTLDKSCRKKRTFYCQQLLQIHPVYEVMWKHGRAGQATDDNMAQVHSMLDS